MNDFDAIERALEWIEENHCEHICCARPIGSTEPRGHGDCPIPAAREELEEVKRAGKIIDRLGVGLSKVSLYDALEAAREEEREACAKVVMEHGCRYPSDEMHQEIARRIRARHVK